MQRWRLSLNVSSGRHLPWGHILSGRQSPRPDILQGAPRLLRSIKTLHKHLPRKVRIVAMAVIPLKLHDAYEPVALISWEAPPQLAAVFLNVALLTCITGPGSQMSSGAAQKTADPSPPRPQQERHSVRRGGQGQGQEPEAPPAYKASLADVIPERAGAAETAKSSRPSLSARKRRGTLMMTLE